MPYIPDKGPKMTKSAEELKRLQEAQARAAEIIMHEEEMKRKAAAEDITEKKPIEKTSETSFAPLPTAYKQDWNKIVEEYKKKYGIGPNEKGMLVFSSPAEAVKFFKALAELGLKFFATKYDENDKPVDYHMFSCGNGILYKGTYTEIHAELAAAVKNNPENKILARGLKMFKSLMPAGPNPVAADMRERMQEHRKAGGEEQEPTRKPTPAV